METVRICELRRGDEFEMDRLVWRVTEKKGGRIYFRQFRRDRPYWHRWGGEANSRGAGSMQFVYLIKRAYERNSLLVAQKEDLAAD